MAPRPRQEEPRQFTIRSLILFTTIVAIGSGIVQAGWANEAILGVTISAVVAGVLASGGLLCSWLGRSIFRTRQAENLGYVLGGVVLLTVGIVWLACSL